MKESDIPAAPRPMTDTLKPCPFCDDPMKVGKHTIRHTDSFADCLIGKHEFPVEWIGRWNTRTALNTELEKPRDCPTCHGTGRFVADDWGVSYTAICRDCHTGGTER